VQRVIRTNLQADGHAVTTTATAGGVLAAFRAGWGAALILDADIIRAESDDVLALKRSIVAEPIPTVLVSWDAGDWLMARTLAGAPFISRLDDVEGIGRTVRELLENSVSA